MLNFFLYFNTANAILSNLTANAILNFEHGMAAASFLPIHFFKVVCGRRPVCVVLELHEHLGLKTISSIGRHALLFFPSAHYASGVASWDQSVVICGKILWPFKSIDIPDCR